MAGPLLRHKLGRSGEHIGRNGEALRLGCSIIKLDTTRRASAHVVELSRGIEGKHANKHLTISQTVSSQ